MPAGDAEVFKDNVPLGAFFEAAAKGHKQPKAIANYVINNLPARMAETGTTLADVKFPPQALRELVELVDAGKISTKQAQEVFIEMFATGERPGAVVEKKGMAQVSDTGAIDKFCDDAIAANPGPVADFKAGKEAALNFLKGQVMKLSKGKANPQLVGETLARKIRG